MSSSTLQGPWAQGASAQQCLVHQLALGNDGGGERAGLTVAQGGAVMAAGGEVGRISGQTCMTGGLLGWCRDKKTRMEWCRRPSSPKGEKRWQGDNGVQ
jgi:hypothetical protein